MKTSFTTVTGRACFFANEICRLRHMKSNEVSKSYIDIDFLKIYRIELELCNISECIKNNSTEYTPAFCL